MATVPPFLRSILAEATRISPGRSTASDGTVGDAAHSARISDHNPDSRGVVHACDVTHDTVGVRAQDRFDAHAWGEIIRARCKVGTERRVKYLVSYNFGLRSDVIASPNTGWAWKRQSARDHASHLHISIKYESWVERSTDPIFISGFGSPPPTTDPGVPAPPPPTGGKVVDVIAHPSGTGYYVVKDDGAVHAYGDARYYGGSNGFSHAPIVDMAVRPQGDGYWQLSMDGAIFAYPDPGAPFFGAPNTTGVPRLYTSISPTPDGLGYYVHGRDAAGVDFIGAYGSAQYLGRP
jgi:hypothetical protein